MARASGGVGSDESILALSQLLGVEIEPRMLRLALTHRSFAYENGGIADNERLEFLGDSVLGQAVTVMLYTTHPLLDEGDLAKRRASLVSTVALAQVARSIGLGPFILLGRGEDLTGGRDKPSILADTVEAIIGAVYLHDSKAANALVLRLIEPLVDEPGRFGASMDPKTTLQELAAQLGRPAPTYTVTESGPDHGKRFMAELRLGDALVSAGEGTSKKQAELSAALDAVLFLQSQARAPSEGRPRPPSSEA